jgi:hypothetical protein
MRKFVLGALLLLSTLSFGQDFTTNRVSLDPTDKKTYHVKWNFSDSLVTMEYISPTMVKMCSEQGIPTVTKIPINQITKNAIEGFGSSDVYLVFDDKKNIVIRITLNYKEKDKTYSVIFESKDTFTNQITQIIYLNI